MIRCVPDRAIKSAQSPLRLISDDFGRLLVAGETRIAVAPHEQAPFVVDAVVLEEDTHLLLTADTVISQPGQTVNELIDAAATRCPARPGSVVLRRRRRLELLAIVYDIDREPMWRERWIEDALDTVFETARQQRISALGLPLLGTGHGSMHPARVAHLIARALRRSPSGGLRRLWIQASNGDAEQARSLLTSRFRR